MKDSGANVSFFALEQRAWALALLEAKSLSAFQVPRRVIALIESVYRGSLRIASGIVY